MISRKERAVSELVELLITPFDALLEIDSETDSVRSLYSIAGKYFVPAFRDSYSELFRYCADMLVHPDDRERYVAQCAPERIVRHFGEEGKKEPIRCRFRYKLVAGGWRWVEQVSVGGVHYGLKEHTFYNFLYDVQNETNADAAGGTSLPDAGGAAAERNSLTGLLWDDQFFALAEGFFREHREHWCVLAIDIEHFKIFNEWYGRDQGDLLLSAIGTALIREEQHSRGIACYFGQDDFGIWMPYDMERIRQLYEKIHDMIKHYGTSVGFMPAFGVYEVDADESGTVYEIYDRAVLASRRAKENYHERIRVYEPSMYQQTDREYRILADFQKALRDHELYIQLQPQCQIATGQIVGAESLVRWRKANGEMVSPGVFVPALEKYGFITDLDKFVWEEVCVWQKKWIAAGNISVPISVNVSQIDIFAIDVPQYFDDLLRKYELPVDAIKIEIAESAYVDNGFVVDTVSRLRERGFLVLMDDFGSGYSSLNVLRNLNVDIIKLDVSFLRMSGDDQKGVQIMGSIVNMAKTMGVPIIVEGVETQEESDFLGELGCRYVQGYYFYRPMQLEEFELLIADPERIDTRGFRFKADEQFHIREFLDQNIFSDTVLNNILGPVAFYSLHDGTVDILRYNQQYRDEIKLGDLDGKMKGFERLVVEEDLPILYGLFAQAKEDLAGGAEGVLRIDRPDHSIAQLRMRFFFLEKDETGERFYGSIHDLTEFITLSDHMRLLSRATTDSTVFVRRREKKWNFRVVIHGLRAVMGISWKRLQDELSDGRFYLRIDDEERERLCHDAKEAMRSMTSFSNTFHLHAATGETVHLRMRADYVHDQASGVEYILNIRAVAS